MKYFLINKFIVHSYIMIINLLICECSTLSKKKLHTITPSPCSNKI